jgi:hypothetical protein
MTRAVSSASWLRAWEGDTACPVLTGLPVLAQRAAARPLAAQGSLASLYTALLRCVLLEKVSRMRHHPLGLASHLCLDFLLSKERHPLKCQFTTQHLSVICLPARQWPVLQGFTMASCMIGQTHAHGGA